MMHQISANTRLCRVCIWPRPLSAFSSFPSLWLQWMPQNMWWRQPLKLRKFHEYGCAWKWGRPIPHPTSHLDGNMIHHWILGPWPIFRHTNMTARFLRWQVTLVFSKVVTKRVQQPAIFARFWAPRDGRLCQCVCVSQLHEILPGNGVWHMFWAFQSLIFWMPRPFHSIEFDCGNVVSPCAWDSQSPESSQRFNQPPQRWPTTNHQQRMTLRCGHWATSIGAPPGIAPWTNGDICVKSKHSKIARSLYVTLKATLETACDGSQWIQELQEVHGRKAVNGAVRFAASSNHSAILLNWIACIYFNHCPSGMNCWRFRGSI